MKHISVREDDPNARQLIRQWEAVLRGQKVLLIDDDIELLRLMAARFHAAGAEVEAAVDGQAGLARFIARPAALVVTDIIMPNREGIETIVALRKAQASTRFAPFLTSTVAVTLVPLPLIFIATALPPSHGALPT